MNKVTEWRIAGGVMVFAGVFALFTGRAGLTYYGSTDGLAAKVVGVLMILCGIRLALPQKPKKGP